MSSNNVLLAVNEHGWRSGFVNMLRKENSTWWETRKWWVQTLIWILISNGVIAFMLWGIPLIDPSASSDFNGPTGNELLKVFLQMEALFTSLGVMVLSQGLIVYEKKFGTAAWLLSNPVSRSSFLTSKLIGHGLSMFIILVAVPSLLAYLQLAMKAGMYFNPVPFIAATSVLCLLLLFYLVLALMLGTLFSSTGPVIGISLAVGIGMGILRQLLGTQVPWLVAILPESLIEQALGIVMGQSLPADWYFPLISTGSLVIICIAVAIFRFAKEEF
ncbi:MAG TPA: ABC transporter permease subunit [Anaerolineales bacterium]|nr:ABC transporter permease subunit [Anaerolineales bacterium]